MNTKIFTKIGLVILFTISFSFLTFGQTPEMFKYQAVLRDASGNIIANQNKTVVIDILKTSPSGTSVFTESHNVTTTAQGLINLNIGSVNSLSGIDWTADEYFIQITVDGTIMGTSQLLSVPYALTAKTVENVDYSQITNTPNLSNFLTTETDPVFSAWDKSTGISITESQISDLGNYIETETDPAVAANFDFSGAATGDLLQFNGTKWVKVTPNYLTSYTETDPVFTAWDKDYNDLTNKPTNATTTTDGFMSSTDKTKLDGLQNADGSETKLSAGTNITITGSGTTASPYVINASSGSATHYVGELYGGGVVFWVDHTGQHGLIVSMIDLSTAQAWSNVTSTEIGVTAQSDWDGNSNTTAITGQSGHTSSAAKLCADYTNADYGTGTYSDWYLPSRGELNHLWNNLYEVQKALDSDGNGSTTAITKDYYWSSSEYNDTTAWSFAFFLGGADGNSKSYTGYVRAVRAF